MEFYRAGEHISILIVKYNRVANTYGYENVILDNENIELCDKSFTIGIIKKDSFTKVQLDEKHKLDLSKYTPRSEFLIALNNLFINDDTLFIGTTAREMYSFMKDTNNFYMAGNMGGALVLEQQKLVIVCGGDAEFVMHMGGLSTAGR